MSALWLRCLRVRLHFKLNYIFTVWRYEGKSLWKLHLQFCSEHLKCSALLSLVPLPLPHWATQTSTIDYILRWDVLSSQMWSSQTTGQIKERVKGSMRIVQTCKGCRSLVGALLFLLSAVVHLLWSFYFYFMILLFSLDVGCNHYCLLQWARCKEVSLPVSFYIYVHFQHTNLLLFFCKDLLQTVCMYNIHYTLMEYIEWCK